MTAHVSDPRFVVLHALRITGVAGEEALAERTGAEPDQVRAVLDSLGADGLVHHRDGGPLPGWALIEAGRGEHARLLGADVPSAGRAHLVDAYSQVLRLNEPFKDLCTAWQLRDVDAGVPNDHADEEYDATLVARLGAIHDEVMPVVADLAGAMSRFGPYAGRFEAAMARLVAGDTDAFTRPLAGSYHDVWGELHEDLLLTLGIERQEGVT